MERLYSALVRLEQNLLQKEPSEEEKTEAKSEREKLFDRMELVILKADEAYKLKSTSSIKRGISIKRTLEISDEDDGPLAQDSMNKHLPPETALKHPLLLFTKENNALSKLYSQLVLLGQNLGVLTGLSEFEMLTADPIQVKLDKLVELSKKLCMKLVQQQQKLKVQTKKAPVRRNTKIKHLNSFMVEQEEDQKESEDKIQTLLETAGYEAQADSGMLKLAYEAVDQQSEKKPREYAKQESLNDLEEHGTNISRHKEQEESNGDSIIVYLESKQGQDEQKPQFQDSCLEQSQQQKKNVIEKLSSQLQEKEEELANRAKDLASLKRQLEGLKGAVRVCEWRFEAERRRSSLLEQKWRARLVS